MQLELFLASELSDEFRAIFVPCSGRRCLVWLSTDVPGGSSASANTSSRQSEPMPQSAAGWPSPAPCLAEPAPRFLAARGWLVRRFQLGERRLAFPTPPGGMDPARVPGCPLPSSAAAQRQ